MDRGRALWIAVVALAAFVTVWMVAVYGVNVPLGDQIPIGRFLIDNHGRIFPRLGDLFAQHNESRKFFPRLVFFYLARLTHWNVKAEMFVEVLMACGIVACVAVFARRNLAVVALASLLIFSPVQWWNWLVGIQIVVFAPILMLCIALIALQSARPLWLRVAAAAVACVIATFSYANGMLLWGVLLVPLWFVARKRWGVYVFWLVAALASVLLYFHDYHRPHGSPPLESPLADPVHFIAYVFAFLGRPLSWSPWNLVASISVGVVLVVALAIGVAVAIRRRDVGAVPAITIGLYALASTGATAIGRLRMSLPQALEARYTTFSIYLAVAVVLLCSSLATHRAGVAAAVALVVAHVFAVVGIRPEMMFNYRTRLLARSAVQFALVSPDRTVLSEWVDPKPEEAISVIDGLARIGYLDPPPLRSDLVNRLRRDDAPRYGAIDRIGRARKDIVAVSGRARLPGGRLPHAVVVTRAAQDGDHVFAISIRVFPDGSWYAWIPERWLRGGVVLHAWAYDSADETAYRLAGVAQAGQ